MKTIDQVYRYTKDCEFSQEDWESVLEYCREVYSGGKVHKATSPKSKSTYAQFIEWMDKGFGSGDFVRYGDMMGLVGHSTPDFTCFAAYFDSKGKFMAKEMQVTEPGRMEPLDRYDTDEFRRLMMCNKVDFDVKSGKICEMYTPKEYDIVVLDFGKRNLDVAMFLESDKFGYHFLAYLSGKDFELDYYMPTNYTPIRPAKEADIKRFFKTAIDNGWSFNRRAKRFAKLVSKKRMNHYWYLNERFQMVSDVDNGSRKHADRFDAGNYFIEQESAYRFLAAVVELSAQYK